MKTTTVIATVLAAAVSLGASFNAAYPAGYSADDFAGATNARLYSTSKNPVYLKENGFTMELGASNIVVTLASNVGFAAGETVYLEIEVAPKGPEVSLPSAVNVMTPVKINLGTPIASDGDGVVASQAATAAGGLATGINGAFSNADNTVATLDVPRNIVAAWTGAAVLTVTGTDVFGNTLVESSASGTSFTGSKAFKTVTDVSVSADVTGLTVGTSKVLGLPTFLADATDLISEAEDGAAPTAGTLVPGDVTVATATTGDVRGTYSPNSNPNGSRAFEVTMMVRDPASKGIAQFTG